VKHVPKSVKIWLHATALEKDPRRKKRVLRAALQVLPGSAKLWRTFVDLEDPQGARILLSRAVECIPHELDLWLALARLESYENAKAVLNRALRYLRAEPAIWLTGAKLEESHAREGVGANGSAPTETCSPSNAAGDTKISDGAECPAAVSRLVTRAVKSLSVDEDIVKRERWLEEARDAALAGFPITCKCIIDAALPVGVECVDHKRVWLEDASMATKLGSHVTARAIYARIAATFPGEQDIWQHFADCERQYGTPEDLERVLENAVKYCPRAEILWLMVAKHKWKNAGVEFARDILSRAFQANPDSEEILLAAAKVEAEVGEYSRARSLLQKARKATPSARVWMKSALLERRCRCRVSELLLLEEGVDLYPEFPKLWLMLAQFHETEESSPVNQEGIQTASSLVADPRAIYYTALKCCPTSVPLWCGLARAEVRSGKATKARAALERGRQSCQSESDVDVLWEESVLVELRMNGRTAAQSALARGLKDCSGSGRLWSLAIALESRARQRARSVDALKHCDQNPHVLVEAGKLLWRERKIGHAREWLTRAVRTDPTFGDALATLYAFETSHGTEEQRSRLEAQALTNNFKNGKLWTSVSKAPGNEGKGSLDVLRDAAGLVSEDTLKQAGTVSL
jgi:pre-mRNA-processing factor 6